MTPDERSQIKEVIRKLYLEIKLNEAATYASIYGIGIAIGTAEWGIYTLEMDTDRDYFSMSSNVLTPVTEEMVREMEADSVGYEIDYYWEEGNHDYYPSLFDWYDDLLEKAKEDGYDKVSWDALSAKQKDEAEESFVDDFVRSKMDSMSGDFTWKFAGKNEDYYLDMVSGGQGRFDDLKYPIIPKKIAKIFMGAWDKLHLKKIKDMDQGEIQLMKQALDEYSKLAKQSEKLLEKSIQAYMVSGKRDKAMQKILKKLGYKSGKVSPKSLKRRETLPLFKGQGKKKLK